MAKQLMTQLKLRDLSLGAEVELDAASPIQGFAAAEFCKTSIAPKTLQAKTFWASDDKDVTPTRAIEEYEYRGNKVTKFVIEANNIRFDEVDKTILGVPVNPAPADAKSVSEKGYRPDVARSAILHPLEQEVIIDAIRYPSPIVLVNIFVV